MKKVTASAGALVLAGVGTVALAAPGGAQSAEDIPSYPTVPLEAENTGGLRGEVQLGNPGFDHAKIDSVEPCPVDGSETILVGVAIEIWGFDADGEPQMLDEGYAVSESEFWGGDVTQYISEDEMVRWNELTPDNPYGTFASTGEMLLNYTPPAVNGEQTIIAQCLIADYGSTMEEDSLDDLERADEGFVATYTVTGGEDPDGGDPDGEDPDGEDPGDEDTPPATEPPADDPEDDDDDVTTPAPTPVTGDPSLTG